MVARVNSYVRVEATYPHDLLTHLSRVIGNDISIMKDRESFLWMYSNAFKDDRDERALLELAYDRGVIGEFFKCSDAADWTKRVLIEKTVNMLVGILNEKKAVMLVESLMYVFGFDFKLKIERRWEAPEDERADFHENMSYTSKSQLEILDKIRPKEDAKQEGRQAEKPGEKEDDREDLAGKSPGSDDREIKGSIESSDGGGAVSSSAPSKNPPGKSGLHKPAPEKSSGSEPAPIGNPIKIIGNIQNARFYRQMSLQEKRTLKKAFQGNIVSQCKMGEYYSDKNTEHLDLNEAARWYALSANNGYERAFFSLGRLCEQNPDVIPDGKERALKIYSDMANQGYPTAQCILGMKYWYGDGVESDVNKAIEWLKKAAVQKHENAVKNLADLYYTMNDMKNAKKWYEIGANAGDWYCREKLKRLALF